MDYMRFALCQLNRLHYEAEPDYFKHPDDIESEKDLSRYLCEDRCFACLAVDSDQYLGFAVGELRELASPISKPLTIGSIEEIFIEKEFRGTGVGRHLMAFIENHCRERGASELFTEVWGFNEAALRFYAALGLKTHVHWLRKTL